MVLLVNTAIYGTTCKWSHKHYVGASMLEALRGEQATELKTAHKWNWTVDHEIW